MNRFVLLGAVVSTLVVGCSSAHDAFAPERVQRSKEMYGRQQQSGENLNRTPAEEAAARHDTDAKPKNPDSEENKE